MGRVADGVFAAFDDDDFRWWILRQADAGDVTGVHRTMGHLDRGGVNAWFAARDSRNEVGDYAGDLDLAWELADAATGSADAAGLQCRYALLRAVIGDMGARFRPELAALLVRSRVWTRDQALAWGRVSLDAQSGLALIADAIEAAEGTNREELMSLALTTSTRMTSPDDRTLRLAAMARTAPPHEQSALLDGILGEANSGSRLGGLRAVAPHLPADLLSRARKAARAFPDGDQRAEAILAVAAVMPPAAQADAHAEVLAIAHEELARPRPPNGIETPGVRLLEMLAAELPASLLGRVLDLAREAQLAGYDSHRVMGAVACRLAQADPAAAVRRATKLATGPRDSVLAAAAQVQAEAGHVDEAIASAAAITVEQPRTSALQAIAGCAPNVEHPALLAEVRRLSPPNRIEVLRKLAARASHPSPALLGIAEAVPDLRGRLRARTAIAPALTRAEVADTLTALTGLNEPDSMALAELAPHLTAAEVRRVLNTLPSSFWNGDAITALAVRLAKLGSPEEALARLAEAADPAQLYRPEALATLAAHLPERLLPAVRAAIQPAAPAEERVSARLALLARLPVDRVPAVVAEAAALEHPSERAMALAALVAAGQAQAEPLLISALRETAASRHAKRASIALKAVQLVAHVAVEVSEGLIAAVHELPFPRHRLQALLALACSGPTTSARAASEAVVEQILAGHRLGKIADEPASSAETTYLADAVLAVSEPHALALVVVDLAPLLSEADRVRVLHRALTIEEPAPRLLALSALCDSPALAGHAAAAEQIRLHEWSEDQDLLPLGLQVLAAGGMEANRELVDRAWAAVLGFDNPAVRLAHVTTLAETGGAAVPAALITEIVEAELGSDPRWRWPILAALARQLTVHDLTRILPVLSKADPVNEETADAAASCAVRSAELHDQALMLAFLTAVPDPVWGQPAINAAADRLPADVLRVVADHCRDGDALAALAVRAARYGDAQVALNVLSRIPQSTSREIAVKEVAGQAQPSWAEDLLPLVRELPEGPRAEALAALIPRVEAHQRADLVEEAVHAAQGYRLASAPRRRQILGQLAPELARLPAVRVANIWSADMRVTAFRGRDEVLVDVAALAGVLIETLGPTVAQALDDAIQVGGGGRWP
ncbi:hypothetical protein ACI8AV_13185 [Geodermatophilus sp. SYSU D00804]